MLLEKSNEDTGPNRGRTLLIEMCCYPFSDEVEHLNVSAFFMQKVNIIWAKQFESLKTQPFVGNGTDAARYILKMVGILIWTVTTQSAISTQNIIICYYRQRKKVVLFLAQTTEKKHVPS